MWSAVSPWGARRSVRSTTRSPLWIPSPAILEKIGLRFRKDVDQFAADHDIPVIRFAKGERKLDVMRPHLDRLIRAGESSALRRLRLVRDGDALYSWDPLEESTFWFSPRATFCIFTQRPGP